MADENFNKLTSAQTELLAFLSEELGEAIQAIGKVLRHGYELQHPDCISGETNRDDLCKEIGHVLAAILLLNFAKDLSPDDIDRSKLEKLLSVTQYMHHQDR